MKNVGCVARMREMKNVPTVLMLENVSAKAHVWRDKCILEDDNDKKGHFSPASFLNMNLHVGSKDLWR
jgi:hypothetical protein